MWCDSKCFIGPKTNHQEDHRNPDFLDCDILPYKILGGIVKLLVEQQIKIRLFQSLENLLTNDSLVDDSPAETKLILHVIVLGLEIIKSSPVTFWTSNISYGSD